MGVVPPGLHPQQTPKHIVPTQGLRKESIVIHAAYARNKKRTLSPDQACHPERSGGTPRTKFGEVIHAAAFHALRAKSASNFISAIPTSVTTADPARYHPTLASPYLCASEV